MAIGVETPTPGQPAEVAGDPIEGLDQVGGVTTKRRDRRQARAFGDGTVAAAMLDRLLHRATVVGVDGPSYRLRAHQQTADLLHAAVGHRGGNHAS